MARFHNPAPPSHFWTASAYGPEWTLSRNTPGLTQSEAEVGIVIRRDGQWFARASGADEIGPFDSVYAAKTALARVVGDMTLGDWS